MLLISILSIIMASFHYMFLVMINLVSLSVLLICWRPLQWSDLPSVTAHHKNKQQNISAAGIWDDQLFRGDKRPQAARPWYLLIIGENGYTRQVAGQARLVTQETKYSYKEVEVPDLGYG